MLSLDNWIILILILLIAAVYCSKNLSKEDFEIMFAPYYPISSDVNIKVNNFKGDIEDFRLNKLKEVLESVKFNANDGENEYLIFNYADRPITKSIYSAEKVKPITDFLMEAIGSNLPDGHTLSIKKLQEISKLEVEEEAKVTFKMICSYKINSSQNSEYRGTVHKNPDNNDLVIDVEVISIKKSNVEKLHLNNLSIMGTTSKYLPGSNYYKNDEQYLFSQSLSNKLVETKIDENRKEMNNMNELILPEMSMNEETINEINTEDVESFFDV